MKAIYLNSKGGAEALVAGEIPRPVPNAGNALVKVLATAVAPTELRAIEQPLKISVVFEDDVSARRAEILIRHRHAPPRFPSQDWSNSFLAFHVHPRRHHES